MSVLLSPWERLLSEASAPTSQDSLKLTHLKCYNPPKNNIRSIRTHLVMCELHTCDHVEVIKIHWEIFLKPKNTVHIISPSHVISFSGLVGLHTSVLTADAPPNKKAIFPATVIACPYLYDLKTDFSSRSTTLCLLSKHFTVYPYRRFVTVRETSTAHLGLGGTPAISLSIQCPLARAILNWLYCVPLN